MPDCPKCGGELGMWERGLLCPVCMTVMTFLEAEKLPGYNASEVYEYVVLYQELMDLNLLRPGVNAVKADSDGVTILHPIGDF